MQTHLRILTALFAVAPLGGCCAISNSLSALFCGPRKDPWVTKDFRTPAAALKTFLGAVAREDQTTMYLSLGHNFKQANSLGEVEFITLWNRKMKGTLGLNLADQVEVSVPRKKSNMLVYTLSMNTVPSAEMEITLVRQNYWSVTVLPDGSTKPQVHGKFVPKLEHYFKTLPHPTHTPVQLHLPGPAFPGLEASEFQRMELGREWKIGFFRLIQEKAPEKG